MRLRKPLLCLSLVGLLACLGWPNAKSDGLRGQLALVERERLWRCHGSYSQLEQLDWRLSQLHSERADLLSQARVRCERLFQEQEAQKLWMIEQSAMQAQVEQATREFAAQTEREMKAVRQRFQREMQAAQVPEQDLRALAAAAVTRFRLEKQKKVSERLQARGLQLAEEVARLEDDLARQFQAEKVDLQVNLQLRDDEAARLRLAAISDEIDRRVTARRQLVETEMRDYTSIEEGQLAIEVRDYEQALRKEMPAPAPDLSALRHALLGLQQQRQAQLIEVVGHLEARARSRFQEQLSGLRGGHERAGEIWPEAFLEPKQRARLRQLPELIREVKRRREAVYARLSGGISRVVGEQARRGGFEAVITDVRLNLQLEDLTDVSLAGVSQLK
ncbi:MAG: hypothetical protein KF760_35510 [Candidatus Eremiobacteraeota bacterium]|nr:hypothetical protein [Candidatus Eremiobacteraeota bacterium]MCW5872064.1 hypothetical protein [Candidatus Eremiobacteraeota bacterium]